MFRTKRNFISRDNEKAFDSVNHMSLKTSLEKYNLMQNLITGVKFLLALCNSWRKTLTNNLNFKKNTRKIMRV